MLCRYFNLEHNQLWTGSLREVYLTHSIFKSPSNRSFFPVATNNHTQSMRVDENIRFYANIIEFNEGTIGTSATIGTTDTSGIRHLNK